MKLQPFYSPLNSMWQAATLGGPKPYSSASSLPGFYSTGYPPTPPKDSQTDEPPAPSRATASNSEEYINSSLSSSISSEDLMSNDMKPTPESLMGFHSFPYSSRKIQEGRLSTDSFSYIYFYFLFLFCSSQSRVLTCVQWALPVIFTEEVEEEEVEVLHLWSKPPPPLTPRSTTQPTLRPPPTLPTPSPQPTPPLVDSILKLWAVPDRGPRPGPMLVSCVISLYSPLITQPLMWSLHSNISTHLSPLSPLYNTLTCTRISVGQSCLAMSCQIRVLIGSWWLFLYIKLSSLSTLTRAITAQ